VAIFLKYIKKLALLKRVRRIVMNVALCRRGLFSCLAGIIIMGLSAFLCPGHAESTTEWSISPTAQLGGWRNDVAVGGNIAALAEGLSVTLHDISGDTPQKLSTLALPVEPTMIAISGNRLYGVSGEHWDPGLFIATDISDPSNPQLLGTCQGESYGGSMAVYGDYVYFSTGWKTEISVIDVTDPESPVARGKIDLGDSVFVSAFSIDGDRLYAQGRRGVGRLFFVYSLSNPLEPALIGELAVGDGEASNGISIAGNLAYSALGWNGVRVVDVSNPQTPSPRSLFPVTVEGVNRSTNGLYASGNFLYVAGSRGVVVYDVADIESPTQLGTVLTAEIQRIDGSTDGIAALTWGDAALHVIRMSNEAPIHSGSPPSPTMTDAVFATGDRLYMGGSALWIYDATDPYNPALFARDERWRNFHPKALQGNLLLGIYNSTPESGSRPNSFGIVDVGDAEDLQEVSTLLLEDPIQDAAVSGSLAYLLGEYGSSGASIIDFSDPASPTQPGTIPFPSTGSWSQHSIAASGSIVSIAGITDDGPRVHVFDAASPVSPILKAALTPSGGSSISLWMSGMALFISSDDNDNNNFIEVYDLTDPAKPRPAGSIEAEGRAMNVAVLAGGDDDPIILLAKPGGSVHTYGYNVQTETITEGPVCPSPDSYQVTVSQTPNSTGSYTVVTTDSS
jgi:hypothetical protein